MDLYQVASELSKKIEKLHIELTDGRALKLAVRQAKQAEKANLEGQLQSLGQLLPGPGVTKVIHKQ